MRYSRAASVLLIGIVAVVAGCATTDDFERDPLRAPGALAPGPERQFSDIPVAEGSKYIPGESFSAQGMDFRVGQFIYRGGGRASELARFYRDEMPDDGWEEVRNLDIGTRVILFFAKGRERCTVIIQRGRLGSTITIWLQ
ncbi:MAG: hypothetical protein ACYS8X_15125 [Planctomycetota bacterium]|jgi:hypothetical protein